MKKPLILFISILTLTLLAFGAYLFYTYSNTDTEIKSTKDTEEKITVIYYFVPVTHFKNLKSNITLEELKQASLVTLAENEEILPEDFDVETVGTEALSEELKQGKIALLTPDQVTPIYKTLAVDNEYIWANDFNRENYPLVKQVEETINTDQLDQFDHLDQLYHFDLSRKDSKNLIRDHSFTLFAAGEIIPARAVDRLGLNVHNNYTYLFDFFAEDIANADIATAMLENPLVGNPSPCTGCVVFVGDEQVAKGLADVGFNFISTAGNHAGDGGQSAFMNTLELLDENKIAATGTGKNDEETLVPAVKTVNDLTVGMLAADDVAYYYWNKDVSGDQYGTNSFSNVVGASLEVDTERVQKIKQIKKDYDIDYLIVFMSWGVEYTNKATDHQQELAKALIDNGADLVIGSHPHWVQNIEFYKDKAIIYSLGNFIFDQTHHTETRQGAAVNLHYYKNELKAIEIMSHQSCGYHQQTSDIAGSYINGDVTLEEVYAMPENQGCVYYQPKKLREDHPGYQQVLERVWEYTSF